jgi:light-regulated signal transduction histidine kinase (bacteriophytochrome)
MKETKNYDSEFCGSLPIHMINVVQTYGALIVVNKESGEIIQISENVASLISRPLNNIIGLPISSLIEGHLNTSTSKEKVPTVISFAGKKYLGFIHNKPTYYIIELNLESETEATDRSFIDVYLDLRDVMGLIENTVTLNEAAEKVAKELKKISRFDKVMIYRFDENWNGHVIAEEKEADMESYMNFTFPASDIPKQARDLYEKNPYRFIPDTGYKPVKLYPVINPATHTFIDISDCNVRGVTSVHLEYLSNMNVRASMSTRIMKDGKLWGLLACHHKTPVRMNFRICAIFELLSNIFSSKISTLENKDDHVLNSTLTDIYTSLVEETFKSGNIAESLLSRDINLLGLFSAGGVVITGDTNIKKGQVPDAQEIEDLMLWLQTMESENIYVTDRLPEEYDYAAEYKNIASGMIAIPVDTSRNEYILIFRPEVVQTVNWGGDPETRINFEEDMKTYHPRFSFKLWQELVKGMSIPWRKEEIAMAENVQEFLRDFNNGKNYDKN